MKTEKSLQQIFNVLKDIEIKENNKDTDVDLLKVIALLLTKSISITLTSRYSSRRIVVLPIFSI